MMRSRMRNKMRMPTRMGQNDKEDDDDAEEETEKDGHVLGGTPRPIDTRFPSSPFRGRDGGTTLPGRRRRGPRAAYAFPVGSPFPLHIPPLHTPN
eukprot:9472589-Pyramimonas_sp.AAC.1